MKPWFLQKKSVKQSRGNGLEAQPTNRSQVITQLQKICFVFFFWACQSFDSLEKIQAAESFEKNFPHHMH